VAGPDDAQWPASFWHACELWNALRQALSAA
jgi:hypothetical protein